jgi:hypothetical protein
LSGLTLASQAALQRRGCLVNVSSATGAGSETVTERLLELI